MLKKIVSYEFSSKSNFFLYFVKHYVLIRIILHEIFFFMLDLRPIKCQKQN
jgi:hypothetical protein